MSIARYLTHPQVQIDQSVPVPLWGLNAVGSTRARAIAGASWLAETTQIIASSERKAIQTAEPIAAQLDIQLEIRKAMHENDRSATGFLPPTEFEAVADEFFSHPSVSVRGWERAIDAQTRIVREVESVLGRNKKGDILFVGHGAVGTLLFCHYSKCDINRDYDQPAGGGYLFSFRRDNRCVIHGWRRVEDVT